MSNRFVYYFDWDEVSAVANFQRHGVSFKAAVAVFRDPAALSCVDDEHRGAGERWITFGQNEYGLVIAVVHTFDEWTANEAQIRIISARHATARECRQYEAGGSSIQEPFMKTEYDLSRARRGKFFRDGATFEIPVYVRPELLAFFTQRADVRGIEVSEIINDVLNREMQRIKADS